MKLITVLMIIFITFLAVAGCSKSGAEISKVKNGVLPFDKSISVGQAFDGYKYFDHKEWKYQKTEQERRIVTFVGSIDMSATNYNDAYVDWIAKQPMVDIGFAVNGLDYKHVKVISDAKATIEFVLNVDNTFDVKELVLSGKQDNGEIIERKITDGFLEKIYKNEKLPLLWFLYNSNTETSKNTNKGAVKTSCLKYDPSPVELSGVVRRVVYAGPPNYESVESGDEPEVNWILHLQNDICVQGNHENPDMDTDDDIYDIDKVTLFDLNKIQLNKFENKNVVVKGTLDNRTSSPHYHTPVVIDLSDIKTR